jgi:MFS family permease
MAVMIDLRPLRHRDFRLLWLGLFVSKLGTGITFTAVNYQVYQLTKSTLAVGLLGLVELFSLIFSALIGGAFADAVDRRLLARVTEFLLLLLSLGLAANAGLGSPHVWVIFVVTALAAILDGFQRPALEAMLPRLVPHDELTAASAVNSLRWTVGFLIGPLIGGFVIATSGLRTAYLLDAISFAASLAFLAQIKATPVPEASERPSIEAIRNGLRYARSRPELMGTYIIDIVAMFFGMPLALLPAFAARFGDARAFGVLNAAPFFGALFANLTSKWTGKVHRHGKAIIIAASLWGLGIVGLGFANSLWSAFIFFAIAGGSDMISGVFRSTIWSQTIPDAVRGRLAGIEMISYSTGPLLGNVESAGAALLFGVPGAIVSGGLLCIAGSGLLARILPEFWRYDARTHPAAVAERERRAATYVAETTQLV